MAGSPLDMAGLAEIASQALTKRDPFERPA